MLSIYCLSTAHVPDGGMDEQTMEQPQWGHYSTKGTNYIWIHTAAWTHLKDVLPRGRCQPLKITFDDRARRKEQESRS